MIIPPRKEIVAAILAQFEDLRQLARETLDNTIVAHYETRVEKHDDKERAHAETAVWLHEIKVQLDVERARFRRWLGEQPTSTGDTK